MSVYTSGWEHSEIGFEPMMGYAWYLYTEDKKISFREEASSALRMIVLASRMKGINRKPVDQISISDLTGITEIFSRSGVDRVGAKLAAGYLLKFISHLISAQLIKINLIDLAFQL